MFFCFLLFLGVTFAVNDRPIIGVLVQPTTGEPPIYQKHQYYVPASYVKWLESAGARVAPIYPSWSDDRIASLFEKLNGVIFIGGSVSITTGRYAEVARNLLRMTIANNKKTPFSSAIWGTCLGFELLMVSTASAGGSILTRVQGAVDVSLPLKFSSECSNSSASCILLNPTTTPQDVYLPLQATNGQKPVAYNHHVGQVKLSDFNRDKGLLSFWRLISTSQASDEFVSTAEALDAKEGNSIYTTQWHPEKPAFEWSPTEVGIDHSKESVNANEWMARFFVNRARLSNRSFSNDEEASKVLIYHNTLVYTGDVSDFEECYFFD